MFRADIAINHSSLSRAHAIIAYENLDEGSVGTSGFGLAVVDLGSRNGTFINGERLKASQKYSITEGMLPATLSFGSSPVDFLISRNKAPPATQEAEDVDIFKLCRPLLYFEANRNNVYFV